MTIRSIYRPMLAVLCVTTATTGIAQSNRRPPPLPDSDVPEPARDTRSTDVRKLEIAAAAKARTLPMLTAGMVQVCRVQSWQFTLVPQLNNAVRMDVSPTLNKSDQECLRSVVYASRYHFSQH